MRLTPGGAGHPDTTGMWSPRELPRAPGSSEPQPGPPGVQVMVKPGPRLLQRENSVDESLPPSLPLLGTVCLQKSEKPQSCVYSCQGLSQFRVSVFPPPFLPESALSWPFLLTTWSMGFWLGFWFGMSWLVFWFGFFETESAYSEAPG